MQRCVITPENVHFCDTYIESSRGATFLIGDGFFNRYYTYFDLAERRIGLARNKEVLSYKNMYKPYSDLDDEDKEYIKKLG